MNKKRKCDQSTLYECRKVSQWKPLKLTEKLKGGLKSMEIRKKSGGGKDKCI